MINIYTDGACKGNPGPGGWGALIISGESTNEIFGGEANTTNNRMEILAVIMALKTIIQQWDKMKSVDALRDYFLKREGVLKINDSGYELHIEKQTTDILLRFLPWNLSIIKSSIMKLKLIIDWKYI